MLEIIEVFAWLLAGPITIAIAYELICRRQEKLESNPASTKSAKNARLEKAHRASIAIMQMTKTNNDGLPFDGFVQDMGKIETMLAAETHTNGSGS